MNKAKIFYLVLIVIFLVLISFFSGRYYENTLNKTVIINDTISQEIEKIEVRNDSLLRINDSINFKVIEIEKTYEKTIDDIIRNNPYDDYNFFSTYIERYCGYNNFDTTKNSKFNICGTSDVEE